MLRYRLFLSTCLAALLPALQLGAQGGQAGQDGVGEQAGAADDRSAVGAERKASGAPAGRELAEGRSRQPSRPWQRGIALRRIGIRGSVTHADDGDHARWAGGGTLREDALAYFEVGRFSVRYLDFGAIGYGSADLEGGIGGDLAAGLLLPFSEQAALAIRAGVRASLLGNDLFYSSMMEFPQLQTGFTWSIPSLQTELSARCGLLLDGRYFVGDRRENLARSPTFGAFASLRMPVALLELGWTHFFGSEERARSDSDEVTAMPCAMFVPVAVCIDARYRRMQSMGRSDAADSSSDGSDAYLGLTLGLVDVEWR